MSYESSRSRSRSSFVFLSRFTHTYIVLWAIYRQKAKRSKKRVEKPTTTTSENYDQLHPYVYPYIYRESDEYC